MVGEANLYSGYKFHVHLIISCILLLIMESLLQYVENR